MFAAARGYFWGQEKEEEREQYPPCLFDHEPLQIQQSAQIHMDRQDQRLVSREKFLELMRDVCKSVETYGKYCIDGKPPKILATTNDGVNLQMRILKASVQGKLRSGSDYDFDTIKLAQVMSDNFTERIRTAKKQQGQSNRVKQAIKRMEIYAGVIDQTLEDPDSVADPRQVKYNGPSGAELDERIREKLKRGEKMNNGFSSLMSAQHKLDDLAKDVQHNPKKYQRDHERMLRESERKPRSKRDSRGYIPADDFIFDLPRDNLKASSHDGAPNLDGSQDEKESQNEFKRMVADRESFFLLVRKTIEMARLYAEVCRGERTHESVLKARNAMANLYLSLLRKSVQAKLKSTNQYDRETVFMALYFAGQFVNDVIASARSEKTQRGGSLSVATKRLRFYADAIETVLNDPSKVGLIDVYDEIRQATIKKVNANIEQVVREHRTVQRNRYKSKKILKEIPDDAFHFHVHGPDSEGDRHMAGASEYD